VFGHGLAHDRISVRTGYEASTRPGCVAGRETGEASLENGSFRPDLGQIWQTSGLMYRYGSISAKGVLWRRCVKTVARAQVI
jgi:hypothetical protein